MLFHILTHSGFLSSCNLKFLNCFNLSLSCAVFTFLVECRACPQPGSRYTLILFLYSICTCLWVCVFCYKYCCVLSVRIWYRAGIYNIHRSHKSISWRTVVGSAILPHAVYVRHRLAIWYAGRRYHFVCGHETLSECWKRGDYWRNMRRLRSALLGLRTRRRQLCFRIVRQLCRKFSIVDHCVLRVHCSFVHLRLETVRKENKYKCF